ncbi:hypothetical protein MRX96_046992 [Rhipicephalus microplus]|uniref:Evasin n=1 Tax=Rhipicephalus microplus TaxID=6941 RepID=A0A6M2D354_RHIMP|nr:uncharacterized protein LOC119179831 [Rhipicephalus microplus]
MIQFLAWALLFITIACHEGHGNQVEVPSGHSTCRYLHLHTPAGNKPVGCTWHCTNKGVGGSTVKSESNSRECLTVSPTGFYGMKCGVNYTCKLGLCDEQDKCNPSNLFVGCWKEADPQIAHSQVQSFGCPD